MNDARMTIRLPGTSLAFARKYANDMGITVTELVVGYFERIRKACAGEDIPHSVRDVAGIVPKSVDAREIYRNRERN